MKDKYKIGDIVVDSINILFEITGEKGGAYMGTTLKTKESYSEIKSSCRLATQSEIEAITGAKEFVLPEKWCLLVTKENKDILNEYIRLNKSEYIHYTNSWETEEGYYFYSFGYNDRTAHSSHRIEDGYSIITFDQFKQFVLKDKVEKEGICTNTNSKRHDSCEEKYGCKQHCDDCDYYSLNVEKDKVMSKEELLEKARLDYPVGSKIKNDGLSMTSKGAGTITNTFIYEPKSNSIWNKSTYLNILLYKDSVWAEIISKPKTSLKVEDLVEGGIYYLTCGVILKVINILIDGYITAVRLNTNTSNRFKASDSIRVVGNECRLATQEEKEWLEECIRANRFIPKKDLKKEDCAMKFKIGDKVVFNNSVEKIPNFYAVDSGVPKDLIIHGDNRLHKEYTAEIVHTYKEFYIVKYLSINNKYVQLGFKEESLSLLSLSSHKVTSKSIEHYPWQNGFSQDCIDGIQLQRIDISEFESKYKLSFKDENKKIEEWSIVNYVINSYKPTISDKLPSSIFLKSIEFDGFKTKKPI